MNVGGQQSLILSGEYPPDSRGAGPGARASIALPSGGAVLQRVTVLAAQPGDNVVMLRADYAAPAAAAHAGNTYEALAGGGPAAGNALPLLADASTDAQPDRTRAMARSSSFLPPAAQYALTQGSRPGTASQKGGVIDVLA